MQNQISGGAVLEGRDNTPLTANGMPYYYTNMNWGLETLLSVTYYDSYPQQYGFNPPFPSAILGEPVLTENPTADGRSTKGLPVLSLVKNIEDDGWTKTYTYYDKKGRAIGSHSINHLGGYTHTESKLDFAGLTQQTITRHKRLNSDAERVVTETFEYDHQNRLLVHKHQVDSNPVEILAQNNYNELSQLTSKKVGGTLASPLQNISYAYNIRGWMTKINDPKNLGASLFGYEIKYNKVEGLEVPNTDYSNYKVQPKYNGNIAEVDWKTSTDSNSNLRRYGYVYDTLNRLTAGFYQKDTNPSGKEYNELLAYDVNGNILNLVRTQEALSGSATALVIDNLVYTYTGNRLNKVSDAYLNNTGYPVGGNEISYDDNGNMTTQLDKGISSIQYNYLNLPGKVIQNSKVTDYIYRADGVKVKKSGTAGAATDYLDGFQYTEGSLKFVPTSEGYFNFENNKYIYNYTDHLGNIRLSYAKNGAGTEIIEESNYYPFGLKHEGYNGLTGNLAYKYKYQGQELQETGFYSFKWRNYMPDVGRFFNIDPLAEKYTYNSTYVFQENKLGMGVELEGLELLRNHTGFFAIHGNEMRVVRAPGTQASNGRVNFTAASIGLTTKGYNPGSARISDGSSGLKLNSYKYSGPTTSGAQMQDTSDEISNKDRQSFTTTKRGSEMWNKWQKITDKAMTANDGVREIVGLVDLASNIPDAVKSTKAYTQAAKDVNAITDQAITMDQAINKVDSSGIKMTPQTRNDVVNYVFDGTLPNPGAGLMPNSLIISNGTQIMKTNGIPIQPLNEQLNVNKKVLP
ncbi:hypothetical protein DBR28_11420 [Chryseobacterium sp. HMWF028]|nr:hypothetical protein DBR28_11420 [Chryseobacterium sp. HMWF028]